MRLKDSEDEEIVKAVLIIILAISGIVFIWVNAGFLVLLGVYLLMWANNIPLKKKEKRINHTSGP